MVLEMADFSGLSTVSCHACGDLKASPNMVGLVWLTAALVTGTLLTEGWKRVGWGAEVVQLDVDDWRVAKRRRRLFGEDGGCRGVCDLGIEDGIRRASRAGRR